MLLKHIKETKNRAFYRVIWQRGNSVIMIKKIVFCYCGTQLQTCSLFYLQECLRLALYNDTHSMFL